MVFVVIVNYCHPEITLDSVHSLCNSVNAELKIVVVDNASTDDSYEVLREKLPAVCILLKAEENNGFASGSNIGIQYALAHDADFVMLLNNDTIVDSQMVSILVQYTNDTTVTAPKMFYNDDSQRIWFAGGKYLKCTGRFIHVGKNELDGVDYQNNMECDFLSGCCFMMTAETARTIGLLDETYFMYMEDVDYSLRLKNSRIKLMMIPTAKLWHKVGISSGGETSELSVYYGNRNRLFLQKKFGFSIIIRLITCITRVILMSKGFLFNTNQKYIWHSLVDYFGGRMGKQERNFL